MKKYFLAFLACALIVSCSGRKEYRDEDYKQQQVEYEKKKADLNKSKGEFYKANKEKLMALVELIDMLKDTTKSYEDVPTDSNYYKNDVAMKSINFDIGVYQSSNNKNIPEVKVVFLHRLLHESSKEIFMDPFKGLKTCYESKNDIPCTRMKEEELQNILNLKYAFILDDIIKVNPVIKGSEEFESGLYIGRFICYDIVNKKPLLSFVVGAQNSKEISSYTGSAEFELNRDFDSNIRKELEQACEKHFLFN